MLLSSWKYGSGFFPFRIQRSKKHRIPGYEKLQKGSVYGICLPRNSTKILDYSLNQEVFYTQNFFLQIIHNTVAAFKKVSKNVSPWTPLRDFSNKKPNDPDLRWAINKLGIGNTASRHFKPPLPGGLAWQQS
jgi:hypothetical protein